MCLLPKQADELFRGLRMPVSFRQEGRYLLIPSGEDSCVFNRVKFMHRFVSKAKRLNLPDQNRRTSWRMMQKERSLDIGQGKRANMTLHADFG